MTDAVKIYHNPRCSKSRETLSLLQSRGIDPEVVLYLETPPDAGTLRQLLQLLGDIPWVGEAFTNRRESTKKVELVILLKPTVVEKDTWQQELQRSSELLDKWYPPKG